MKLASYKDGSRDGQLLVVSSDLSTAHYATGIATRLQQVLDDWNFLSPQLQELAQTLDHGKARHAFAFDPRRCMAPLPRAFLHAQPARNEAPDAEDRPQLCRSDALRGTFDTVDGLAGAPGVRLRAGIAALTGDIPAASPAHQALEGLRLLVLAAGIDASATGDTPLGELAWAFAPVAVTPDELGAAWQGGRARLRLRLQRHGATALEAALDGAWAEAGHTGLGEQLAILAATQGLRAGSLVGGGLLRLGVGGQSDANDGPTPADPLAGRVALPARLEALDASGTSPFGAISFAAAAPADAGDARPASGAPAVTDTHGDAAEPDAD